MKHAVAVAVTFMAFGVADVMPARGDACADIACDSYLKPSHADHADLHIFGDAADQASALEVKLLMTRIPWFRSPFERGDYFVGLKEFRGGYRIFAAERQLVWSRLIAAFVQQIWSGPIVHTDSPSDDGYLYAVEVCDIPVDGATAAKLVEVWETMLSQARDDDLFGFDGEIWEFRAGDRAANAWSPRPSSNAALLVGVGEQMISACQSTFYGLAVNVLRRNVDTLLARLAAKS